MITACNFNCKNDPSYKNKQSYNYIEQIKKCNNDIDNIEYYQPYAHGAFGQVYKYDNSILKFIFLDNLDKDKSLEKEITITKLMSDNDIAPKLIKSYIFQNNNCTIGIIQAEFCETSMKDCIRKGQFTVKMIDEIVEHLKTMIKLGWYYLDTKPDNLMLKNNMVKFIDFGSFCYQGDVWKTLNEDLLVLVQLVQFCILADSKDVFEKMKQSTFFKHTIDKYSKEDIRNFISNLYENPDTRRYSELFEHYIRPMNNYFCRKLYPTIIAEFLHENELDFYVFYNNKIFGVEKNPDKCGLIFNSTEQNENHNWFTRDLFIYPNSAKSCPKSGDISTSDTLVETEFGKRRRGSKRRRSNRRKRRSKK